jgi:hypothetical protein
LVAARADEQHRSPHRGAMLLGTLR